MLRYGIILVLPEVCGSGCYCIWAEKISGASRFWFYAIAVAFTNARQLRVVINSFSGRRRETDRLPNRRCIIILSLSPSGAAPKRSG